MRIEVTAVLLTSCALVGCNSESMSNERRNPAAMSAPPTDIAVGPIPGTNEATFTRAIRNPLAGDAGALQDGRRLYETFNCVGCHGGRAGGGMGPSLRDEDWRYGNSDAHIFDSIASGRDQGMPAWGTTLPQSEIWKLVAYIQSLRTPEEPKAPR
jgi:cytochrome c oxidase cbb3-type subunit III